MNTSNTMNENNMIELLMTKVMASGTMVTKTILPTFVPLLAMSENMITEQTGIPLTIVAAVGGACWYLNGRFTRIETKIEDLTENIMSRSCQKDKCNINQDK
jgi:hypothetical protein